jgi:hypothetical protein
MVIPAGTIEGVQLDRRITNSRNEPATQVRSGRFVPATCPWLFRFPSTKVRLRKTLTGFGKAHYKKRPPLGGLSAASNK